MKINLPNIASVLVELGVAPEDQAAFVTAAAARAIAYRLPLPTEAVADRVVYFGQNCSDATNEALDQIGEQIPLHREEIEARVQTIWSLRYDLVFCPVGPQASACIDAALAICKVDTTVPYSNPTLHRLCSVVTDSVED